MVHDPKNVKSVKIVKIVKIALLLASTGDTTGRLLRNIIVPC